MDKVEWTKLPIAPGMSKYSKNLVVVFYNSTDGASAAGTYTVVGGRKIWADQSCEEIDQRGFTHWCWLIKPEE